jgi:hypothetical protein
VKYFNAPSIGGGVSVGNNVNFAQSDGTAIFFGTDSGVFRVNLY